MRTIGFRVEPAKVTFAIHDEGSIINLEVLKIPNALEVPEKLKYVRNNVLDILREYNVEQAVIRVAELTAQQVSVERLQIEAVIQEAFASSHLAKYSIARLVSLARLIGVAHADVKKYVSGELIIEPAEKWRSYTEIQREAVLCATGAVNV
jgi:Holliday junction resolvasome RuvABC endonuclease subunit